MKKRAIKILKYLLFLAIGVFIFWLIYKDQDIEQLKQTLTKEVNYWWVWLSLLIGLFSHVSRVLRWKIMIEPLGKKPRFINTFFAVMVGYFMNLALPRMGELSRCGVLSKYEKISFTKLVGTVVLERAIDMLMLLILTLIVIITQFGKILKLLADNPELQTKTVGIVSNPVFIIGIAIFIIAVWIFRKKFKNTIFFKKINVTWQNILEGIRTIKTMKNKGAFIFHSVFIWLLYYLMLYAVFFSFDFTSGLPPIAGLTVFVIASYGMVAPVQGGIGAWHFMAKEALKIYGVENNNAVVFALLAHTSMNAMIILIGFISVIALPFVNRKEI